ncbi:hypothetical protein PRZ48_001622 [Zasmidium cellare]|uniref:Uncharacterized protein n=1 Tax=Zasmidium cellare TaxID=395010 RepID=A0ABR0F1Z4_ZASCE|nr:hypothetical protein PRZ48_001622 [Zasmidium cellare]
MASSSPSEFLTFYRRLATSSTLRYSTVSRATTRPFSSSIRQLEKQNDLGGPKENKSHALEKEYEPNVQTEQTKKGREHRANDEGGPATTQKDPNNAAKKAKEEFPEAPTTIGFQDERGGKGH